MSVQNTGPDNFFDLSAAKRKLASNIPLVIAVTLIFLAVGLGYTFFAPAKYEARATMYFPNRGSGSQNSNGLASSTAESIGLGGLGPTTLKIFHRFLESESCLDYVASQSGLDRKKIEDSRTFTEDPGANMLTESVILTDGELAKKVLQAHLDALAQINRKISTSYEEDDTTALKSELDRQSDKLAGIERDLVSFQKKADTAPSSTPSEWGQRLVRARVDLASTRSAIQTASAVYRKSLGAQGLSPSDIPPVKAIRPKLVEAQYQLSILSNSLGPDAPAVRHLNSEIGALKDQLKNEVSAYVSSVQKGMVDPTVSSSDVSGMLQKEVGLESEIEALSRLAKVAPSEQGTLAHLTLQLNIQSDLVKQATVQYEEARLQSLRDPNKWSLLDPPRVFPKPVNKHYGQVGLFCFLAGLLVSLVWVANFGRDRRG